MEFRLIKNSQLQNVEANVEVPQDAVPLKVDKLAARKL